MNKIRYKYRNVREGVRLDKVKCPICGNPINWIKVVEHTSWDGKVGLLAECWSGSLSEDKPEHLFLVTIDNLPIVEINRVKSKVERR